MVSSTKETGIIPFLKRGAELFKTESASAVSLISNSESFLSLETSVSKYIVEGVEKPYFINYCEDLAKIWELPPHAEKAFMSKVKIMTACKLAIHEAFTLIFNNGKGKAQMLACLGGKNGDLVDFAIAKANCKFSIAPTVIVIRHTEKGFMYCKSWEEKIEKPGTITEDQINGLFGYLCKEMLAGEVKYGITL